METVELTINELYEARAQFGGFATDEKIIYQGLINEKGISEGTKRLAGRILKAVSEELKPIDERRSEIQNAIVEADVKLESAESDLDSEKKSELVRIKLELARVKADTEYLTSFDKDKTVFKIQVQKLDFTKIEELSFESNYGFIYQKFFNNY